MNRYLARIAGWCFKQNLVIFVVVFFLTSISIYLLSQIKISTNSLDLLPQDSKSIKEYLELNEDFGAPERHIVLIETPDTLEAKPRVLKRFAKLFAKELMNTGMVESVDYSLTDDKRLFIDEFFSKNALLYLTPTDLDSVMHMLSDKEIERAIANCRNILNAPIPPSPLAKKVLREDPLLLSRLFKPYVEKLLGPQNTALLQEKENYYLSKDKRTLLIFAKPTGLVSDTKFCERFIDANEQIVDSITTVLGQDAANIEILIGGQYVTSLIMARAVKQGLINSSSIAIGFIILLFYLYYGKIRSIVIIIVPIVCGVLWVFSFAEIMFGKINLVTAAVSAMLLGLGVDYAIHVYNRYVEQMRMHTHFSAFKNLMIAFKETGASVFYGAISTSFVFIVLMITDFRGLFELGFIGGVGILILFVAVLILIPAEIRVANRRVYDYSYLQIGIRKILDRTSRFVLRHPKYITSTSIIITIAMIAILTNVIPSQDEGFGVTFDENIENIRSKNDVDVIMIKKLQKKFGSHFKAISVVCTAESDEQLINLLNRLNERLDTLVNRGVVKDYNSILAYIPPVDNQNINLRKISKLDPDEILFKTRLELRQQGLRSSAFNLGRLSRSLQVREPITIKSFQAQGFSEIMRRFYIQKNGLKKVVTQVDLAGNSYDINIVSDFKDFIKQDNHLAHGRLTVTGNRVVTAEFLTLVKRDFGLAMLASMFAVLIVITLKYRNVRAIILCLVPLVVSIIWIMGIMRIFGIKINFVNMIVIPLLIGTGIDYGIYITSRYLERKKHDVLASIHEIGQSLFLSAMTSIIGFGSLIFIDYRGLESVGYLCSVGILICAVSSILILPAMLRLWGKRVWKEALVESLIEDTKNETPSSQIEEVLNVNGEDFK